MLGAPLLLIGMLHTWLTPFWLMSVGVALGVLVMAAVYGILFVAWRTGADFMLASVREGILLPIFYLAMFLSAFAVLGTFAIPALPYKTVISSVSRIGSVGTRTWEFEIPAETTDYELKDLRLRIPELQSFTAEADRPVSISTNMVSGLGQQLGVRVTPGQKSGWQRPEIEEKSRVPVQPVTDWAATNTSTQPVTLKLVTVTNLEFPQVYVVPITALCLIGLAGGYMLLRMGFPKISAIALTTAREAMSQPLYYLAMGLGICGLIAFVYIPYNTFGEDIKMLKDSGLIWIMVWGIIIAVWSASVSISEEVEGRTALTVLSKPVKRRQFILGKFLGVLGPVVVLFLVLGTLFLLTVSFKVVHDARETAKTEPPWQLCYLEMIAIVPGLVLAFFETVVLAAISVAISTRLPMLANLIICSSIYVLGHLVPLVVNSSVGKFEIVRFVGQFIATVLPVLDHFNIQAAVAAGVRVPIDYLGMALVYCILYSAIAMLVGLALFEDRDLA